MNEREAWIALAATPGVGDVTFGRLLEAYGSAAAALESITRLPESKADRSLGGMTGTHPRAGLGRLLRRAAEDPGRVTREVAALGGWLLTPLDAGYPRRLRAIEEPPLVLYGVGQPALLDGNHPIAVVGTRRPTAIGRDLATRIGHRLAEARVTVVSGLAVGIDAATHRAVLDGGGLTVAVIGSGIHDRGPAANRGLAERIRRHGAIVGELAPGISATQGTFPRRNRIISGLCDATIVVEAPARSGALITAHHALEQGRQLVVAPGRPLDQRVSGNLSLLRETPARPLIGLDEMIADLGLDAGYEDQQDEAAEPPRLSRAGALSLLEPTQRTVAEALSRGPASADELCRATGLSPGVVAACLTMLQLRGWATVHGATQLPAGPLARLDGPDAA